MTPDEIRRNDAERDRLLRLNQPQPGRVYLKRRDRMEAMTLLSVRLVELQKGVEKFLRDIESVPPWESAGALWADKVKQLHSAWLRSQESSYPDSVKEKKA